MGYMMAFAPCFGCKKPFGFNPTWVPSVVVEGRKEPICAECVERANPLRKENGLEPIVPHPRAYEAEPEFDEDLI